MTIALRRRLVLGLVLSISIAGGALAKDRPLKKDGPKTEAVPPADAAGVNKVFGEGKAPPTYTPPNIVGGVWDKTIIIGPEKTSHEVEMAFDDIAIAKAGKRVFENANPFKLPNNLYTFVILTSGITSFGNPLDETEIGTRHAHLGQGRPVAASGELVKSTAGIRLNFLSGTYMIPMLTAKKNPLDPVKLREHVLTWFDKVLRAKYKAPASFKVVFNQSRKEPLDLDHQWGNEKIFAIEKRPGDPRLPPPPLCALQIKIHACDAKYGFSRRNADFCKLVNDANCAGAAVGKGGARKGSAPKGKGK